MTPTLTLNSGLRWERAAAVPAASTDTYSTATLADLCGMSGIGTGPAAAAATCSSPERVGGRHRRRSTTQYDSGKPGYKTDWNNFAPNVGVGVAAERAGRLAPRAARRSRAGDDPRRLLDGLQPRAHGPVHERSTAPTRAARSTPTATTTSGNLVLPGETLAGAAPRARAASARRDVPDRRPAVSARRRRSIGTANNINIFDPDDRGRRTRGPGPIGFQRSLGRDMAIEVRYVGNRNMNALDDRELERAEHLRERLPRRVQGSRRRTCGANVAAGSRQHVRATSARAPARRRCRSTSPTSAAQPRRGRPEPAYTSTNFTQHRVDRPPRLHSNPEPAGRGERPARATRRSAPTRSRAGLPANFFVMNPAVANANITARRSAARSYHALQLELPPPALARPAGQRATTPTRKKLEIVAADRCAEPRFYRRGRRRDVPHAFKLNWTYELPFGRGRRFGTEHEPGPRRGRSAAGSSPAPAASRSAAVRRRRASSSSA